MKADELARATAILASLSADGASAPASPEEPVPLVYADLRRLAARYLSRERPGHTLQPTALAHEAYLKLIDQTRVDWQGKPEDDWTHARVWLQDELSPGDAR